MRFKQTWNTHWTTSNHISNRTNQTNQDNFKVKFDYCSIRHGNRTPIVRLFKFNWVRWFDKKIGSIGFGWHRLDQFDTIWLTQSVSEPLCWQILLNLETQAGGHVLINLQETTFTSSKNKHPGNKRQLRENVLFLHHFEHQKTNI